MVDTYYLPFSFVDLHNSCWVSSDDRVGRNILGDHAAGANERALANGDVGENGHARSERCALADAGLFYFPVRFSLYGAVFIGGAGIAVIDEHHPVANKNVVFDGHAFADKGVAGNFAVLADSGVFLDLNESTDLGAIADFASVQIDELRKLYIFAELHARGDTQVFIHGWNLLCAHVFSFDLP